MSGRVNTRCGCGKLLSKIGEAFDSWVERGCSEAEALENVNSQLKGRSRVVRSCCVMHLLTDTDADPTVSSFAPSRGEQSMQSQPQQSVAWQVASDWTPASYNWETMSQDDSGTNNWE